MRASTPSSCRRPGRRRSSSQPSNWRLSWAFFWSSCAASRQESSTWHSGWRERPGHGHSSSPIPDKWKHPRLPTRTSAHEFQRANANRESDLSAKRNLGLLLARLHGWNKIAFIDDDIKLATPRTSPASPGNWTSTRWPGWSFPDPDNSVVCHARRLAGLTQDVFVTGAVLGVHCNSLPLSFFPDIYNEDWFFFARGGRRPQAASCGPC